MKAFLDTSLLVASFYSEHEHHKLSFDILLRQKRQTGCTSAHCLAEFYSVVTGMPGKDRASPDEALLFLDDVRELLSIIALDLHDYLNTVKNAAVQGLMGGAIYDAIIAQCALKAQAQIIYTWNLKHFNQLGAEIAKRVTTP